MTAEERDELASLDRSTLEIDPRTVPIRFSHLKSMEQSPLHYRHAVQNQREETLSMRLGSGTHALLFGTPKVVVYRGGEFADAKGKIKTYTDVRNGACWEAFQAKHADDCILSESELAKAEAMARAITDDMAADSLLFADGARHELEVNWTLRGRRCRGRLDALTPAAIPDLKTTKDVNPRWFPLQVFQSHWHAQATWYADGCEAAGLGWRHPYLVAVENSAPYSVAVWRLTDAAIAHGRALYLKWFEQVLECEAVNLWPGFASEVLELDVPSRFNTAAPELAAAYY